MLQRECRTSEVFLDNEFLLFYLYLTPFPAVDEEEYRSDKPEDIFPNMKRFVQKKRDELATQKTVSLNTLKLQYYHLRACLDMDAIWQRNLTEIRRKSRSVLKQVLRINPKSIEMRDKLLRNITALVTIDNGMGGEACATESAVKSILSAGDLHAFAHLSRRDKVDVLDDLKVIVCGIRLFNNDAGHEKEKIVDCKKVLNCNEIELINGLKSPAVSLLLENSFDNTRLVLEYEQELSYNHVRNVTEKILGIAFAPVPMESLDESHVNYLKDISLFVHQRYQLISSILSKLMDQKVEIFETIRGFRKTLKDMHAILIYKTAINTREVYVS